MRKVDVCLSPELLHLFELKDKVVVVVDILRATSCMVTAFGKGIRSIVPFADPEACLQMRRSGYLLAGERNGEMLPDFDLGNSPYHYLDNDYSGERLAMTTTNGTVAINNSKAAKKVYIGAFLNISAVTNLILEGNEDILVLCAGWKGKVNLEDTLFAGALAERLKDKAEFECDAPLLSEMAWKQAKSDLPGQLKRSSHAKRLNRLNITKDIDFCLQMDVYNLVPYLHNNQIQAKYY